MEPISKSTAILTDYSKIYLEEVDIPELKEGQVLVKVEAAPINPSDQEFTNGNYGIKEKLPQAPCGVGFEGAGTVVDAHESASSAVGQKVCFSQSFSSPTYQGTWRQYVVLHPKEIIPFPGDVDIERIASSLVNPLTAIAFVNIAKAKNHNCIVHGAASSTLGKMLIRYCKQEGFPLINIVRREEHVKTLEELGAENIINSSLDSFQEDLKAAAEKYDAQGFFDPIGGDFTGQVLDCMPNKSVAYVYGGLAGKSVSYSPLNFIFYEKTISYFWLTAYLASAAPEVQKGMFGTMVKDLSTGGEIFGSKIYKTFPLSSYEEAVEVAKKHASEGKVLFKPHD